MEITEMCGLAGYSGVQSKYKFRLAYFLGLGIDSRGGHAAGFASITNKGIKHDTRLGKWENATVKFLLKATSGNTCMMHARYATCGTGARDEAHPFEITRKKKPVMYGMHNGVIWDAARSAYQNDRDYTVDSKELFELMADGKYRYISKLNGYGVVTWINAKDNDHIKLCKMSKDGQICIAQLATGGIVWASTWPILKRAVGLARLKIAKVYKEIEVGKIHEIREDEVYVTSKKGPILSEFSAPLTHR